MDCQGWPRVQRPVLSGIIGTPIIPDKSTLAGISGCPDDLAWAGCSAQLALRGAHSILASWQFGTL